MRIRKLLTRRSDDRAPLVFGEGARLGDLQGPVGRVEPSGRVVLDGSGRSIEWGVHGGEQWRRASEERAVRQHRIDDTPVYETWMRVSGGDVIQRLGVVNDGHDPVLAMEFENASSDAVLIAVVGSVGPGERVVFSGDTEALLLDDIPWFRAEQRAHAVVGGTDGWDAAASHQVGQSAAILENAPVAALLLAVPHRQRVAVAFGPSTRVPTVDEIVAGWKAIVGRAAVLDVPDPHIGPAWRRIVGDLVLAAGEPFGRDDARDMAEVAWWLDVAGLHGEADRARAAAVTATASGHVRGEAAVAVLRALASRDLRAGLPSELPELAGPLARLAGPALDRETAALVARALRSTAPDAARDADSLAADPALPEHPSTGRGCTALTEAAANVVGEVVGEELDGLDLVPALESGRDLDVRDLVTTHGRLSYSVRWHGPRPALLWELTPIAPGQPVAIRARVASPDWVSYDLRGETLLATPDPASTQL